jgi:hypothetical protein
VADKIVVPTKQFSELLDFLKPFIAEVSPIHAFTKLVWQGKTMLGQDGVIGAAVTSDIEAPKPLAIEGVRLAEFISTFAKDAQLEITWGENTVRFAGGGVKATFKIADLSAVGYSSPIKPTEPLISAGNLVRAIRDASFCVDPISRAGPLGAVCISGGFVYASDGARATRVPLDIDTSGVLDEQTLIPFRAIKMLEGDVTGWQKGGNMLWFFRENKWLWTRTVEPPYPNLEPIFTMARELAPKAPVVIYKPDEISAAFAAILSAKSVGVQGTLKDNVLEFAAEGTELDVKIQCKVVKSRGEATFFADGAKLKEGFSRFSKLAFCGQGMLFFYEPSNHAEHVVMEMTKAQAAPEKKGEPAKESSEIGVEEKAPF